MEKKVYCEVELDGVNCPKRCTIPSDLHTSDPLAKEYVRQYFYNMGYKVVGNVKFC